MKRFIPVVLVFALMLSLVVFAAGYGLQNVWFSGGLFTNSLTVEFNVGSPSSGEYGTKKSVYPNAIYIKQCSGKIKEGDVDTGWVYSPKAKNPTQKGEGFLKAYVEKDNNLFHACSISYNWYYYN